MTPDGSGAGRRRHGQCGVHRKPQSWAALRRTVAAGGAVVCLGVACEMSAPTVQALSIIIPLGGSGSGNTIQINIFEGNIFNPQFGFRRDNVSNNTTIGGVSMGNGNSRLSQLMTDSWSQTVNLGGSATGNGNVTQINLFSFNIINPQLSLAGKNISNNTTISNVSTQNGNHSEASVAEPSTFWTTWVNGISGNGNTNQLSFFSGNIFNPQWAFGGSNVSNNTAATNISAYNGNQSTNRLAQSGIWGSSLLGMMVGNGNTNQIAGATSNIYNPQLSTAGGNQSFNTATTNDSTGNGNSSGNAVTSPGGWLDLFVGMRGNGNTSQNASAASNIYNDQVYFGGAPIGQADTSTVAGGGGQRGSGAVLTAGGGAGSGGAGPAGADAVGANANSVNVVSSTGAAQTDNSFTARIHSAVDRALGRDSNDESGSHASGFTAYAGNQATQPAAAAKLGGNPTSGAHPNGSGNNPAHPGGDPSDSGNSFSAAGGKGESGAKGDQ